METDRFNNKEEIIDTPFIIARDIIYSDSTMGEKVSQIESALIQSRNTIPETYNRIVAIKEKSAGNDTVGSMWLETKTFDEDTPIKEIVKWGENSDGKLIITEDEANRNEVNKF